MEINYKELKPIDKDLLRRIIDEIPEQEDIEDFSVEVDDKKYGLIAIEESEWQDDGRGKYFSREKTYILSQVDNNWKAIEQYNVIVSQCATRTGSYYTDWYYDYDELAYSQAYEKVIPEQIIPEHTEIDFKPLVEH